MGGRFEKVPNPSEGNGPGESALSGAGLKCLWLLLLFLSIGSAGSAESPRGLSPRQREVFEALSKALNNDIILYGQVVDLEGVPVKDATVMLSARVAGAPADREFPKIEVKTDGQGLFVAKSYGELLGLDGVEKDGYQYRFQYNRERIFNSVKPDKAHGPGFEPGKPVVFRVRKLAPPAFVVIHNMTFGKSSGEVSLFDLIKRRWVHDEARLAGFQYSSSDRDWHTDLRLVVEGEPGKLRLVLETPDDESGLVVEQHEFFEMMTEAPAHGYRRRVEIPVKADASPLTAYVKAQGGLFYARIMIECSERQPGRVAINATSFTNLAGGRGLEYIPWVESQYDWEVNIDHVRKEIRRADLLSGRPIELPRQRK